MKAVLRTLLVVAVLSGFCACESELPDRGPSLQQRLKKGVQGEGSLFIRENESGTSSFPSSSGR